MKKLRLRKGIEGVVLVGGVGGESSGGSDSPVLIEYGEVVDEVRAFDRQEGDGRAYDGDFDEGDDEVDEENKESQQFGPKVDTWTEEKELNTNQKEEIRQTIEEDAAIESDSSDDYAVRVNRRRPSEEEGDAD